jgi:hypothetical protein
MLDQISSSLKTIVLMINVGANTIHRGYVPYYRGKKILRKLQIKIPLTSRSCNKILPKVEGSFRFRRFRYNLDHNFLLKER